uniref:Aspergillopepsin-2 heavy chain n=1 Tax=Colletotrichum fructicola (strain Nara gc5) TaxID=1213859 RepID=L2GBT0_COLFN
MTVDATSKTKGTAKLENLTTGKTVTHTFSSTPSTLCETNAEWIFTAAAASGTSGSTTPAGATIIDISEDGGNTVLAKASVSGSTVTVSYSG